MKYFIILILSIFIISCSEPNVYTPGSKWKFLVVKSNSPIVDTLSLEIFDTDWQFMEKKLEWNMKIIHLDDSRSEIMEATGITDRNLKFPISALINNEISLSHPPGDDFFKLSFLIPPPTIKYPIKSGNSTTIKVKANPALKELGISEVSGNVKVTGKIFFDNLKVQDSCWVLEAVGNSQKGNYHAKYYFNEKYGFVYFNYFLDGYSVEIIPYSILKK